MVRSLMAHELSRGAELRRWFPACAFVALSCVVSCSPDARREPHPASGPFYSGRTLELLVPFATGGGTDLQARFMVPYLQKYGFAPVAGIAHLVSP